MGLSNISSCPLDVLQEYEKYPVRNTSIEKQNLSQSEWPIRKKNNSELVMGACYVTLRFSCRYHSKDCKLFLRSEGFNSWETPSSCNLNILFLVLTIIWYLASDSTVFVNVYQNLCLY